MKKILTFILIILLTGSLFACVDKKTYDDSIRVIFFTDVNATKIKPLENIKPGSKIEAPSIVPTKPGGEFAGWYKDSLFTNPWDFDNDVVNESIVIFAKWDEAFYSITYILDNGTMPSSFKFLEDYPEDERDPKTNPELLEYLYFKIGSTKVLPTPTRTGYKFEGWFSYNYYEWPGAPAGTNLPRKPGESGYISMAAFGAEDITLYAHWSTTKLSISYVANYPVDGVVDNPGSRTGVYGWEFIYDSNFDETNTEVNRMPDFSNYENLEYEFIGWNDKRDGSGNWYHENDVLQRSFSFSLYGQWSPIVTP